MDKFWLCLATVAVCGFAVVGCEDNPDQFYTKAPDGAGGLWNDGNTDPSTSDARNSFNDNFNQTGKDELCAGPVKHKVWADMVNQPIKPPRNMAGLDLAGGAQWTGLQFKDAQKKLCQATPTGHDETSLSAQWGDAGEVQVSYLINNSTINFIQLNQGYRGTLDFASRPHDLNDPTKDNPFGVHTYSVGVGKPLLRDGQQWQLTWDDFDAQATEMFDALMYTYAPELPGNQDNCNKAQTCLAAKRTGGAAIFGARPLGIYFHVPQTNLPQPAPSTPDYIYAFYVKLMPFSASTMFLKLDEEGPIATAPDLGDKKVTCTQKLGTKYADFLATCVNVLNDPSANALTLGKLLGGFAHDKETYNFTIQGVDTDFASSVIGDDKIIADDWMPSPDDTAYHLNIDVRASGKLLNEYSEDGSTFTFGATGAIYREFARRTQDDIHKQMLAFDPTYVGYPIGDSRCLMAPGDNPNTWRPAKGCTGFEQLVTPAEHTTTSVDAGVRKVSLGGPRAQAMGFKTALKPGDPVAKFCADPSPNPDGADKGATCTADTDCWSLSCGPPVGDAPGVRKCADVGTKFFQHCGSNDLVGFSGSIFDGPYSRVIQYLGGGDPLKVAPALRDRKYYFQHFGYAIVKYLHMAGLSPRPTDLNLPMYGPNGTACGGRTCEPNLDHLQFDQMGATGDRNKLTYTDRRWVDHGKDPISYEYEILVLTGNQQESRFRQKLDRDEKAVFWAMSPDKTKPVADEANNLRITNIIGSAILKAGWKGVSGNPAKDAYYCATNLGPDGKGDPDCMDPSKGGSIANGPPKYANDVVMLDNNNNPLLTHYRGAFTGTPFTLGSAHMTFVEEQPFNKAAKVSIPFIIDPYDPNTSTSAVTSGPGTTPAGKTILPDWRPLAPGAGLRIPVDAQRDRFVPSAAVDLSGQNLNMNVDYLKQSDGSMKILGVESHTFEGEIFLCRDPLTNDLLSVSQYDSIVDVQAWLTSHPGVYDACDILVRYSPFDQSPVQLTSKKAGITVTVGQGSGIGRIVDVVFFDPTL